MLVMGAFQAINAEAPGQLFNWGLWWSGSWEENRVLANRGEFRLGFTPAALLLRGQGLDKRPLDFSVSPPWADEKSKAVSSLGAGLYHKSTGSRMLYGVLDEWGLSARIRSPWIRGAPFAESHKPLMADLKTVTSSTKEAEAYLYASSPWLDFADTSWRGFASVQTRVSEFKPDIAGGLEALFDRNTQLLLEGFFTESTLPKKKSSSWFSDPPALPERDFRLYGIGALFNAQYWSVSSDWAYSQTFAWGSGIYGNAGVLIRPPFGDNKGKAGPWSLSLAADGANSRFIGRDGTSPGEGFRTAGKIEYRGQGSSLFRINTTLRCPGMGQSFNRSSSGLYYRLPALSKKKEAEGSAFPLRLTRVSLEAERNAANPEKILDGIDAAVGLSLRLPAIIGSPLGINLSGQVKGLCAADPPDNPPSPYPLPQHEYLFDSAKASCEITLSPGIFQFRTKWGYSVSAKKDGQWDASLSAAMRFKHGRLSVKIASPEFPDEWNCTLSWRVEKK